MTKLGDLNQFGGCGTSPIKFVAKGPGCLKVWGLRSKGAGGGKYNIQTICGEAITGAYDVGIVCIQGLPEPGYDVAAVVGLPAGKDSKYQKPNYQFKLIHPLTVTVEFSKVKPGPGGTNPLE
jgi:hypothetical protein